MAFFFVKLGVTHGGDPTPRVTLKGVTLSLGILYCDCFEVASHASFTVRVVRAVVVFCALSSSDALFAVSAVSAVCAFFALFAVWALRAFFARRFPELYTFYIFSRGFLS